MHLDCAILQVSPPDRFGFCSYGINVDVVKPIAEAAEHIIAEINPKMPRTLGDSFIHMDDIDAFILSDNDIMEFNYEDPDETQQKIASYVASLIEDESTIQMGIGSIPNAVTACLEEKKDLGIHSEVFSDGVVDLVDKGVVTCRRKTLHPGKIITSFVMGSRRLYDFVNDNPFVEFHPVDYVNDPYIIAQNEKQVAINAALTVDITGQCNADSLGHRFYSGIGGQVDFIRGAAVRNTGNQLSPSHQPWCSLQGSLRPGSCHISNRRWCCYYAGGRPLCRDRVGGCHALGEKYSRTCSSDDKYCPP